MPFSLASFLQIKVHSSNCERHSYPYLINFEVFCIEKFIMEGLKWKRGKKVLALSSTGTTMRKGNAHFISAKLAKQALILWSSWWGQVLPTLREKLSPKKEKKNSYARAIGKSFHELLIICTYECTFCLSLVLPIWCQIENFYENCLVR